MRLGSAPKSAARSYITEYMWTVRLVSPTHSQKSTPSTTASFTGGGDKGRDDFPLLGVSLSFMPYPFSSSQSSSLIAKCGTTITCVLRSVPLWAVVIVVLLFGFVRRRVSLLISGTVSAPVSKYKSFPPSEEQQS